MTPSQKTVFVIADPPALWLLVDVLRSAGYRAMGVGDAAAAGAVREPLAPDLVIAAYPGLDGGEEDLTGLLLRGRGEARYRAIALLPTHDDRLAAAALADGFEDVCAEPVSASEVLAKVSRLLAPSRPPEPPPLA